MIALLTYPAAQPALSASSSEGRKQARTAAFSDEVWELHRVISNPISRTDAVLTAKRQLLRRLRKFQPPLASKESRRRSLVSHSLSENSRLAGIMTTP